MKTLIMMVGLPRSGKSTYAKESGYPMVNPDSIRIALHGSRFNRDSEPMVWTIAKYMVKSLFEAGHDNVILDATNVTIDRRSEWISRNWCRQFVIVETSIEVCKQRAIDTNQEDLIPVIDRMNNIFKLPTVEEFVSWEYSATYEPIVRYR